jgi:hemerythrin
MWACSIATKDSDTTTAGALEDEHQQIFALLDDLHGKIEGGSTASEQRISLHVLGVFLSLNCEGEEVVMESCFFPLARSHREEHHAHQRALQTMENLIIELKPEAALTALTSLRHALITHVREKDQEIVDWERNHQRHRSQGKSAV